MGRPLPESSRLVARLPGSFVRQLCACTVAVALLCTGALRAASTAKADETPLPANEPANPPADDKPAPMDFDLFGDAPKVGPNANAPGAKLPASAALARDPAVIGRQVKVRRRVLELHTGFGFATLVAFAATLVIGQLNYQDKYGGGDSTGRYADAHLGLSLGTSALFATDAILALAAPTPYKKPIKADAALLHKVMMGIATAGMVTQLALGFATASNGGNLAQRDMALGHAVVGYVTFASMLTGYLSYVF